MRTIWRRSCYLECSGSVLSFLLFFPSYLKAEQGVYGAYFSKLNFRWSRHVRNGTWLKDYPVIEVLLASTHLSRLIPWLITLYRSQQ